jgi:hypothetical protein
MKHGYHLTLPIVTTVLVCLLTIGLVLNLPSSSKKVATTETPPPVPAAPSKNSALDYTDQVPLEIHVKPLRTDLFELQVTPKGQEYNQPGLTSYIERNTNSQMTINSDRLAIQNKDSQVGLQAVNSLFDKPQTFQQDLDPIEQAFHDYGGGAHHSVVKELPGVTYPKMDKTKVLMITASQSVFGTVAVYVLAKKGDNYVRIERPLFNNAITNKLSQTCEAQNKDDYKKMGECYQQGVLKDKDLEQQVITAAKDVINLFGI